MVAQSSTSLSDHFMCLYGSVNDSNHVGSVQPREPRPVVAEPRKHSMRPRWIVALLPCLSRHDCKHLTGQSLPRTTRYLRWPFFEPAGVLAISEP